MNATVTISVVLEGNAATISAAIADLLARLENPTISASVTPELAPVEKPKKERVKRVLTDEQKAAIKERFAAGKTAAQAKREAETAFFVTHLPESSFGKCKRKIIIQRYQKTTGWSKGQNGEGSRRYEQSLEKI